MWCLRADQKHADTLLLQCFLKKFIFIYVITLPIGYVFSLGYLVVPITILLLYVLGSLELIAEEIEDPFGKDTNDLPMERMSENIQQNVAELLAQSLKQ